VFDGYGTEPSTKDHEHRRRACKMSKISPDVDLATCHNVVFEQDAFMANSSNKQRFIKLLHKHLQDAGFTTYQAVGDADADIVKVALDMAKYTDVAVATEDTDILAMVLQHRRADMTDGFFVAPGKKGLDQSRNA
jgi:hypothetical protein